MILLLPGGGDFPDTGVETLRIGPGGQALDECLRSLECDWVWYHDPELRLPFAQVAAHRPWTAAVQPCRFFWDGERQLASTFGRGSVLVERRLWLALGGVPHAFEGSTEIGQDMARRLREHGLQYEVLPFEGTTVGRRRDRAVRERDKLRRAERLSLPVDEVEIAGYLRRQTLGWPRPTPPPRFPQTLPGRLWGLTTYFNPQGYRSKLDNYALFREGLRGQLPLCTVELAFGDQPFALQERDADLLIQLRGADVLWQKERLFNVGLSRLPSDCDKVVWLDCDVLFQEPNWARETAARLQEYVVVQPFTWAARLLPGQRRVDWTRLPLGTDDGEALFSMADGVRRQGYDCLSNYHHHGHTGYAWAARRALLTRHGFYDRNIMGNGDLNMACAMFSGCLHLKTERFSPAGSRHLMHWAENFYSDVQGSVFPLEGGLFHLWHGSKQDRFHDKRLQVLVEEDFDPTLDLRVGENGAFQFAGCKPGLRQWCADYFALRREDAETSVPGPQPGWC